MGVTADDVVPLIALFATWINLDLSSDISVWIKVLEPGNQLELSGISSYRISSYPKQILLLYEGENSGPAEKLELSGNSS